MSKKIFIKDLHRIIEELSVTKPLSDNLISYQFINFNSTYLVPLAEIHPPTRDKNLIWFRSEEVVVDLLSAMKSGDVIPAIEVWSKGIKQTNLYQVRDGFHRYYLSIAMNYKKIPIFTNDWDFEN